MRIILVCGILDDEQKTPMWVRLSSAFSAEFRVACTVERCHYHFMQHERMIEYRDSVLAKHDTGEELILVGHSMGGVVACSIAAHLVRSPVRGIVTIYAPHTLFLGYFSRRLDADVPIGIPIVSFGARGDWLVPSWTARHPQSVCYRTLPRDHELGLRNEPRFSRIIARYAKRHILKPGSS